MIEAKIIADSISETGKRITTFQLKYWRAIHSEFMTHRVFSRNASSSRAIPVTKLVDATLADPAMPIHWGAKQSGMQADHECDALIEVPVHLREAWRQFYPAAAQTYFATRAQWWYFGTWLSAQICIGFDKAGYHKQIANRQLEHSHHISIVVTATEWDNFFELRCHPDAQPEMQDLALRMREAMNASTPTLLREGEWHLPYVTDQELSEILENSRSESKGLELIRKVSAARCCRVSYLRHDGLKATIGEELALCDRLIGANPIHASPFEHQATPDVYAYRAAPTWMSAGLHGNLVGWIQYRKLIESRFNHGE